MAKPADWTTGQKLRGKHGDRHGADVLGVQPDGLGVEGVGLGEVDHRVAAVDAFERESVDEFLAREQFAIVLGRPAEQAQKVDEGLRKEAAVAIGGDADHGTVAALGELGSIGRDQQRDVREARRGEAGGFEDEHVFEGVGEMVLAADDVADAEVGIVGAGGQVVGRHAVAAQQGEVFDVGGGFGLVAVDAVGEAHVRDGVAGDAEAQGEGFAGGGAAVAFRGGEIAHIRH